MVSNGAKEVATALGVERVYEDREFRNNFNHTIINWGNPRAPAWSKPTTRWLNHPSLVAVAINKLSTFDKWKASNLSIPEYTTDASVARVWATERSLVARLTLTGSGGAGIVLTSPQDPPEGFRVDGVKLWTKYIKKLNEYRVHVVNGKVIDTQEKRRKAGADHNHQIRNLEGGYVFCREGIAPDPRRDALAVACLQSLSLNFGSVDIVYNRHLDAFYALECNTASGVEGSSVLRYVEAIKREVRY